MLNTLKSNMASPQVRAVADSDYARQGIKFLEEESPDPQQTGLSWEDAPADLDDDFITPDKICLLYTSDAADE